MFNMLDHQSTNEVLITRKLKIPKITFLIGLPGCGKQLFINKVLKLRETNVNIVGTIPQLIFHNSIICSTLDEIYFDTEKNIEFEYKNLKMFNTFIRHNRDIVIYSNNISTEERNFYPVPKHYIKHAVVFNIHQTQFIEYMRKLKESTFSFLPDNEIMNLLNKYEEPNTNEQFNSVEFA